MKQLIPRDEHGMFADYNDTALVDSRFVADAFEKGHREVLRSIDQILSEDSGYSAEFNRCNFAPISYTDVRGRVLYQAIQRNGAIHRRTGFGA